MAKVKSPLLSFEANGAFGKRLIYKSGKNGNVVTNFHKPTGEVTNKQLLVRNRFKNAKDSWNLLTLGDKLSWNILANSYKLTGYNLFIREYQEDFMLKHVTNISSAQLLDLVANPVTILPALGVGFFPNIISFVIGVDSGSTLYLAPDSFITSGFPSSFEDSNYPIPLEYNLTTAPTFIITGTPGFMLFLPTENEPLILKNLISDLTTGDLTLKWTTYYTKESIT